MAIYKRKDSAHWWVRFTFNGQRVQRSAGTEDRAAAQEYHDRLKAQMWAEAKLGARPVRLWQEAVVRWCEERAHKASLRDDLAKFRWLHPLFHNRPLTELTRDVIHDAVAKKRANASPATANRYLALIRAVLRAAEREWGWIDRAPHLRLYREPIREPRWLRPEEAARVLAELPAHQRDMAVFALATGLRQGNVKRLTWNMVDLDRRLAVIPGAAAKGRRPIPVPLSDAALAAVQRQRGAHPEVVFTYRGKPVQNVSTRAWRRALERAGVEARWHDLRHTFASWHAQNGTSDRELMELGGWRSASMVRRYAHLAADHLRPAADAVGTIVATAAPRGWLPEQGSNLRPAD